MIIDSLINADKYFSIHPLFPKAFEYIKSINADTIEPGKYEILGEQLKMIVSYKQGMPAAESTSKFECHDQHIDIQLCLIGNEQIGWKPRDTCTQQKGEYNPEKDVSFFNDRPDMYFELADNQFAIFFPEDVHAPMIGGGMIKKLVVKVKL